MSWSGISSNQTVSNANLQNAVDTGVFTLKPGQTIPSDNRCITRTQANTLVNIVTITNDNKLAMKSELISSASMYEYSWTWLNSGSCGDVGLVESIYTYEEMGEYLDPGEGAAFYIDISGSKVLPLYTNRPSYYTLTGSGWQTGGCGTQAHYYRDYRAYGVYNGHKYEVSYRIWWYNVCGVIPSESAPPSTIGFSYTYLEDCVDYNFPDHDAFNIGYFLASSYTIAEAEAFVYAHPEEFARYPVGDITYSSARSGVVSGTFPEVGDRFGYRPPGAESRRFVMVDSLALLQPYRMFTTDTNGYFTEIHNF